MKKVMIIIALVASATSAFSQTVIREAFCTIDSIEYKITKKVSNDGINFIVQNTEFKISEKYDSHISYEEGVHYCRDQNSFFYELTETDSSLTVMLLYPKELFPIFEFKYIVDDKTGKTTSKTH